MKVVMQNKLRKKAGDVAAGAFVLVCGAYPVLRKAVGVAAGAFALACGAYTVMSMESEKPLDALIPGGQALVFGAFAVASFRKHELSRSFRIVENGIYVAGWGMSAVGFGLQQHYAAAAFDGVMAADILRTSVAEARRSKWEAAPDLNT
jgi:hypothetical protein